jgi:hypothetical protein
MHKDESRRRELLGHGILKQVPGDTLDYDTVPKYSCIQLRFRSLTASNPYDISCEVSVVVVQLSILSIHQFT